MLKHTMPEHTASQDRLPHFPAPPMGPLAATDDPYTTDDEYIRMLRFYARSSRFVEDQISAELEIEMAPELQNLEKNTGEWGW